MTEWDALQVVGISHRDAGLAVRELFALAPDAIAALLNRERAAGRTAVVLATCNRCELYWHGGHDAESWLRDLGAARGMVAGVPLVRRRGVDAMRHLLRVASGVESQILGETEILGQVRRAYDAARAAGTTDLTLDLLFSAALTAGRRARYETLLGRHPLSVSAAAVDLVRGYWNGSLDGRRVVVVGAGEVAEGVLRALDGSGAAVTVVNRHAERAEALASAWGAAQVREWSALPSLAAEADALLVATAAAAPTVTADLLAVASAGRESRPLRVVDLAVPRNVEPAARGLPGVELSDLDDLRAQRCPVPSGPPPELPEVEALLDDELARLLTALRGRAAAPRLAELHRESARLTEQELEWALRRLEHLGDAEREVVREMAERLVRRVLYPVSRELRRE